MPNFDLRPSHASVAQVPYEHLKGAVKERTRYVAEELDAALADLAEHVETARVDHERELKRERGHHVASYAEAAAAPAARDPDEKLAEVEARLVRLKRKMAERSDTERGIIAKCRARVSHLKELPLPGAEKTDPSAALRRKAWESMRLDRIIVDHLLRDGDHDLANMFANATGVSHLTDVDFFHAERDVVDALRRRDCAPALSWCDQHRAKLRRMKSRLEFRLRIAQFVELVRADDASAAVRHARTHLAPWAHVETAELARVMACLAFRGGDTTCKRYADLFSPKAWDELVDVFRRESHALHALPCDSLLSTHLQAGLSALKVAHVPRGGADASTGTGDPLRVPAFRRLSESLPYAKHTHSKLVCAVGKRRCSLTVH